MTLLDSSQKPELPSPERIIVPESDWKMAITDPRILASVIEKRSQIQHILTSAIPLLSEGDNTSVLQEKLAFFLQSVERPEKHIVAIEPQEKPSWSQYWKVVFDNGEQQMWTVQVEFHPLHHKPEQQEWKISIYHGGALLFLHDDVSFPSKISPRPEEVLMTVVHILRSHLDQRVLSLPWDERQVA